MRSEGVWCLPLQGSDGEIPRQHFPVYLTLFPSFPGSAEHQQPRSRNVLALFLKAASWLQLDRCLQSNLWEIKSANYILSSSDWRKFLAGKLKQPRHMGHRVLLTEGGKSGLHRH